MMGVDSEGKEPNRLQTSRSSTRLSSVPKIWKSRTKSQTRTPQLAIWMPEGNCCWRSSLGQRITLDRNVHLLELSEIERPAYQRIALARLKAININCDIPKESNVVEKPKRRAVLLRKKAATTNIFEGKDGKYKDESNKNLVFGIPLSKCIQNDKVLKRSTSLQSENEIQLGVDSQRRGTELLDPMDLILRMGEDKPTLRSFLNSGPQVPKIIKACFQHLETYGLCTLGLFRVSSSKKRVRQLREGFDRGDELELDSEFHPHDVAQLLKEYFRDLPEPLLTRDLYGPLLNSLRLKHLTSDAQRWLISLLPVNNRDTLWALVTFLSKVAEHSEDRRNLHGEIVAGNKMDAHNLATLIGPNVLRYSNSGKEFLVENNARAEERSDVILVVRNIIEQYRKLFEVRIEDLDAVYRRLQLEDPEGLDAVIKWRFHHQIECELEMVRFQEKQSVPQITVTYQASIQPLTLAGNFPSRSNPDKEHRKSEAPQVPQRKDRSRFANKATKNEISKSASMSSISHPSINRTSQLFPEIPAQPSAPASLPALQPGILISKERRPSRASPKSGTVRFQNERWKRNEIIASEYQEK